MAVAAALRVGSMLAKTGGAIAKGGKLAMKKGGTVLNKSKKVINKIENINEVILLKKKEKSSDIKYKGTKKIQKVQSKSTKDKTEEKNLKKPRTLWTRKRKAS